MAAIRAVLVDDERLARAELGRLLRAHPEVEVAGEAADVDPALDLIARLRPDLLFLDIEMPGGTGFDLLSRLDTVPSVIFATAYDEHALRAFEINALDYLVKPIEPARLAAALERVQHRTRAAGTADRLSADDRVFVRDGDRCWFIRIGDVRLFEAEGNYARVHFGGDRPLIHRSLASLEARLDPGAFFRANRSQIVNLSAVRSIETPGDGRLRLVLSDHGEVLISRRRATAFRERLTL